jgi:hypothetical protein
MKEKPTGRLEKITVAARRMEELPLPALRATLSPQGARVRFRKGHAFPPTLGRRGCPGRGRRGRPSLRRLSPHIFPWALFPLEGWGKLP